VFFRPEMLLPMGLPEGVSVVAWGLSLERPAMIRYGLENIRDLVGHKVDVKFMKEFPICRIERPHKTKPKAKKAIETQPIKVVH